jgi:hypothetical protein
VDTKSNFTPLQAREAGFDRNGYAPAAEGNFTGTLVMKIYGDFCLRCYFETDNGERLKLTAWQDRKTERYGPRGCGVDFKKTPLFTKWANRVGLSRTGKPSWADAEQLS